MTNALPNLALWAPSGAGKSFATNYLRNHHGYRACEPGRICRAITVELFGEESKSRLNLVNDALRKFDPNIWLHLGMLAIDPGNGILIDGIRFKSNLSFCRNLHFRLVRIDAPLETRLNRLKARGQSFDPKTDGAHAGETELANAAFDHVIDNSSDDPQHLFAQLDQIVKEHPVVRSAS